MKDRPAKRQKRNVLRSSDTDDDNPKFLEDTNESSGPQQVPQARHATTIKQSPGKTTRAGSRKKSTANDGRLRQVNLSSFYKKAPGRAPSPPKRLSPTKQERTDTTELEDDLIQDDDQDFLDLLSEPHSQRSDGLTVVPPQFSSVQHVAPQAKHKLPVRRLHSLGNDVVYPASENQAASAEARPWVQRWPPTTLDDLGVHKKKVQDVRGWLESAFQGNKYKRLLVLRGPPGSGKTATVETLGQALGFGISQWNSVQDTTSATGEYTSLVASFEEFLGRGERYGTLQLSSSPSTAQPARREMESISSSRKVLLLEEFPSSLFGGGSAVASFRNALDRFVAIQPSSSSLFSSASASSAALHPLVIIISESAALSSGEGAESFSAHKLLGPDLLTHPAVATIDFNPVAPTLLLKVLERTLKKAAPTGRERKAFSTSHLRALSDSGDMRSAIAALEFLFVAQQSGQSQKSISDALAAGSFAQQRDGTLELFHAVGKVLYNKRRREPPDAMVSDFDVQHVIEETGRDAGTFVAALYENYVPSCEPSASGDDGFLDHADACMSVLSDADLLSTDAAAASRSTAAGFSANWSNPSVDALRQSGMSTTVAVRGLLHALPFPVKRRPLRAAAASGGAPSRDAFKMFYPESMRLRGRIAEMAGYAGAALKGYTELQAVRAAMGGNLHEFELETASYLFKIRGDAAQNARALESFVSFASAGGAQNTGRPSATGKRSAAADIASRMAGDDADLTASIAEQLYLSDDDIED